MASDGKKEAQRANEYTAMSLYQLLGAPLHALVDAESHAAAATARFIAGFGFEPGEKEPTAAKPAEGAAPPPANQAPDALAQTGAPAAGATEALGEWGRLGKLRMARFHHRAPDGSVHNIEVPVLSLVPIPALQIKEASIDFAVKVVDTVPLPAQLKDWRANSPVPPNLVDLKGSIARQGPIGPGTRQSETQMRVKVTVQQADLPSGLARLFHVMDQHVTAERHARVEVVPGALTLAPGERDAVVVALRDARGEPVVGVPLAFDVLEGRSAAVAQDRREMLRFGPGGDASAIRTGKQGTATVVVEADARRALSGHRLTVVVRNGAPEAIDERDLAATFPVEIRPS
ncbi:MAG TPA: DUF2589 domain-containing protein [Anaeromyxobacteraceae bacterium]|nr:DUF2589 domain-containing protein [Anaeromyxobacteraceae bacterium]